MPTVNMISKSKAASDGIAEVEAVLKDLKASEQKLKKATGRLKHLSINTSSDSTVMRKFQNAKEQLLQSELDIRSIADNLEAVVKPPGVVSVFRHSDLRRIPDHRRNKVLLTIMVFWNEAGRKLTFTTDPISSERRGVLIDFVNAIVGDVSDPPGKLKGESIVAGIKDGKKAVKVIAETVELLKNAKGSA